MDEWVKQVKNLKAIQQFSREKEEAERTNREAEILKSEASWMDRMSARIQELNEQDMVIRMDRKVKGFVLTGKGNVEILSIGRMNFSILYLNIYPPTNLMVSHVITVYHHRLVRVREMSSHNIEEVLKYVALGMETYTEIARYDRVERNLEEILEVKNQYERVHR